MSGVCSKGTADIMKEGLDKAMEVYKSLIYKTKTTGAVFSLLMRTHSILFDPDGGYFYLKDHVVALLGYFGGALKEDDLPSTVKRHLNELKRNLTEAEKYLENIKKRIEERLKFVKGNLDRVITKKELKEIQLEQNMIKRDLDVCKMHVTDAKTEVQNVEKSVNALLAMYGIGVATVAIGGIACGAGVMVAGASNAVGGAACGAIAGATLAICYKLLEKSGSYAKWLTEFKNDKLPKLEQGKREFDLELLKKNLDLLDVAD
ncbi:uncharacterized protein [Montipora capricornis]|uniref:uncharacterized protein n=1 Tax=Montipora capricornis TaxID=246305 RepID=UPI0035F1B126